MYLMLDLTYCFLYSTIPWSRDHCTNDIHSLTRIAEPSVWGLRLQTSCPRRQSTSWSIRSKAQCTSQSVWSVSDASWLWAHQCSLLGVQSPQVHKAPHCWDTALCCTLQWSAVLAARLRFYEMHPERATLCVQNTRWRCLQSPQFVR